MILPDKFSSLLLQKPSNSVPVIDVKSFSQNGGFNGVRVLEESSRLKSLNTTSDAFNSIKDKTETRGQTGSAESSTGNKDQTSWMNHLSDVIPRKPSENVIDMGSTSDPRHQNQNEILMDLQLRELNLTEEELLPPTMGMHLPHRLSGQGQSLFPVQEGQEKLHKHGDVISGSDGRRYRLIRGPQGPAGHLGKGVSDWTNS